MLEMSSEHAGNTVEDLQWRLHAGEGPTGIGARLAALLIGTNDIDFAVAMVSRILQRPNNCL